MIFDRLENRETYRAMPEVYRALTLLAELSKECPPGGYAESDGSLRINKLAITTKPEAECRYEAHRKYLDIHCTLTGAEVIFVQEVSLLQPLSPFDTEKDIGFYAGEPQAKCVLSPGCFLLCFPQDAHKVCISDGKTAAAQKLIAKLRFA